MLLKLFIIFWYKFTHAHLTRDNRLFAHLLCVHESSGTFKYCSCVRSTGKHATARLSLGTDSERIDPKGSSGNNVFPLYSSLFPLQRNTHRKYIVIAGTKNKQGRARKKKKFSLKMYAFFPVWLLIESLRFWGETV